MSTKKKTIRTPRDCVFLDTQVFRQYDSDFENAAFARLVDHSQAGRIFLASTEIVEHEILKHLRERAANVQDAFDKARRLGRSLKGTALPVGFFEPTDARTILKALSDQRTSYLKRTKAVVLSADRIEVKPFLEDYFECRPPFEASGDKKAEFPDAISAAILKRFAIESGSRIAVVSGDAGFLRAFEGFAPVQTYQKLPELLEVLSRSVEVERVVVDSFREFFPNVVEEVVEVLQRQGVRETGFAAEVDEYDFFDLKLHDVFVSEFHHGSGTINAHFYVALRACCSLADRDASSYDNDARWGHQRVRNVGTHILYASASFLADQVEGTKFVFTLLDINEGEAMDFETNDSWS